MKGARAKCMYQSKECSWADTLMARITLGLLFFLTLAYMGLVPAILYYSWQWWPSPWLPLLFGLILSTIGWARGPWRAFGETRGFEAWRRYFKFRIWREEPSFGQNKNVLFALVPHGLFPLALPLLSGVQQEAFPELSSIRTAVATAMLWTPVLAPMLRWFGCIPATSSAVREALQEGSCILIPDGIAGAFHSDCVEERIYLQARTGFIRMALQQGSLLVPIYCFGHTQLWDVWPSHDSWAARLSRRFQFSLIWFWGEWWMPPLPRRVPLVMVVGKGIPLAKEANPSPERIRQVHLQFTQALSSLYSRYRAEAEYGASKPLLIV